MSAFWIFAIVLTIAYIIYYAVMICIDLYGKPKESKGSEEEVFDIGDMEIEESKVVEETEEGFRVAGPSLDNSGQKTWDETKLIPAKPKEENAEQANAEPGGSAVSPAQEKAEKTTAIMEEIEPKMNSELANEMLHSALTTGKPPVCIKKVVEKAPETKQDKTEDKDDKDGGSDGKQSAEQDML